MGKILYLYFRQGNIKQEISTLFLHGCFGDRTVRLFRWDLLSGNHCTKESFLVLLKVLSKFLLICYFNCILTHWLLGIWLLMYRQLRFYAKFKPIMRQEDSYPDTETFNWCARGDNFLNAWYYFRSPWDEVKADYSTTSDVEFNSTHSFTMIFLFCEDSYHLSMETIVLS